MTAPLRVDPQRRTKRAPERARQEAPARPRLEAVAEPQVVARRRRRRSVAALGVSVAILLVFGVLAIHVLIAETAFALQTAQRHVADARERNRELLVQLAELEAPGRIRREAVERLHMQMPDGIHYLEVSPVPPASVPLPAAAPTTAPRGAAKPAPADAPGVAGKPAGSSSTTGPSPTSPPSSPPSPPHSPPHSKGVSPAKQPTTSKPKSSH